MEEILNKLLNSELLTEETRQEISEAFKAQIETVKEEARQDVEVQVRAQLVEQWTNERDMLVEAVDTFVEEAVQAEMKELREDIESFRDLEVEFAGKIVEEKQKLAEQLESEMDSLIDNIDGFLEARITSEMDELKEDITEAKKRDFGVKIFESFVSEFNKNFVDEESVQAELAEAKKQLEESKTAIEALKSAKVDAERQCAMESVLAPLSGSKREQMSLILENVETAKLQDTYNLYIGRVLKESAEPKQSAAEPQTKTTVTESKKKPVRKPATRVVTGDKQADIITESKTEVNADLERAKALAGL